jgi:transposase-like protein
MRAISFKRHRFPPEIIRLAVWLYFRFTLSIRDVEEMVAQRGVDVNFKIRRRVTRIVSAKLWPDENLPAFQKIAANVGGAYLRLTPIHGS